MNGPIGGKRAALVLVAVAAILAIAAFAVLTGSPGGGDGGNGNVTPTPQAPSLKLSLSYDNSERGRLVVTMDFINTGNGSLESIEGNVSLREGGEELKSRTLDIRGLGPGRTRRVTQFYTVKQGRTYKLALDLRTSIGPLEKVYRIKTK